MKDLPLTILAHLNLKITSTSPSTSKPSTANNGPAISSPIFSIEHLQIPNEFWKWAADRGHKYYRPRIECQPRGVVKTDIADHLSALRATSAATSASADVVLYRPARLTLDPRAVIFIGLDLPAPLPEFVLVICKCSIEKIGEEMAAHCWPFDGFDVDGDA